jgi:hypothetical protein
MRRGFAALLLVVPVVGLISLLCGLTSAELGARTAQAQDSTPTPPARLEVAGLWSIGYMGPLLGTCHESLLQGDSYPVDTLSGNISCTHAPVGDVSGALCQPSSPGCKYPLLPMAQIDADFQDPNVTVNALASFSFDGNSSSGSWQYISGGTPVAGTFTGQRIADHYEASIPASSGGQLTTQLNDILTVPPGALPSDQQITIDIQTLPSAPPEGLTPVTRAYAFGPAGLTFSTPVTAVFHYTDADLAGYLDPQSLRVYVYNPATESWGLVGGVVNATARTVTVQFSHFSTFGILGASAGPAPTPTPGPTPSGVGGAVSLPPAAVAANTGTVPGGFGRSAGTFAALASGLSAAFLAIGAGAWYVRRRRAR